MTDEKRAKGDWQTPYDFALSCCRVVRDEIGFSPEHVIEPTCGTGNFIAASRNVFPNADVLGIELNHEYITGLKKRFHSDQMVEIRQADFLKDRTSDYITESGPTLILGNPPWVTVSTLSALGSDNLPEKKNFKGFRGIDAMTGKSNFDISEWIILQALSAFRGDDDVLAMLCKTSVARNIATEIAKARQTATITILVFNGKQVFDVSASTCFLICDFRSKELVIQQRTMGDSSQTVNLIFDGSELVEKLNERLAPLLGRCQLSWRQGIKHDCSKIMELNVINGVLENKLGEKVDVEEQFVYPLTKSSKSRRYIINDTEHAVIVTQRKIGEDTTTLANTAPKLWKYLCNHTTFFDARKSSIYKNAPRFAMFGIGDYSYAPFKVGVSGFYKKPVFSIAFADTPIMFDDTCYFLSFNEMSNAVVCMLLLNSPDVLDFYQSVAFLDSKRPYTKKVLDKLDLEAALHLIGVDGLNKTANQLNVDFLVKKSDVDKFLRLIKPMTLF